MFRFELIVVGVVNKQEKWLDNCVFEISKETDVVIIHSIIRLTFLQLMCVTMILQDNDDDDDGADADADAEG